MLIKICGQTRTDDIRFSFDSGADLCGVVIEVPSSPRSMTLASAEPIFREFPDRIVALTADAPDELYEGIVKRLAPAAIQLTANESPDTVRRLREAYGVDIYKSLHLPTEASGAGDESPESFVEAMRRYTDAGSTAFVLDTRVPGMYGGSGKKSDWHLAERILTQSGAKAFIAGGITPDNAARAAGLNPYGIDLASGVEESPGVKSQEKIRLLFKALEGVKR